jgi:citrate synthase
LIVLLVNVDWINVSSASEVGQLPRLTTAQVAARLGVKPETVYAYVSRGVLTRDRAGGARGSTFDALEVEALAQRTRRPGAAAAPRAGLPSSSAAGSPLMVLDSALTLIADDELYFRGVDATTLCTQLGFESAAHWLWTGVRADDAVFAVPANALDLLRQSDSWRAQLTMMDRLRVGVAVAGSINPLRQQIDDDAVLFAAAGLFAILIAALHDECPVDTGGSTTARLWAALSPKSPGPDDLRLLNAVLVLLMDHDLAMSTMAVRVAASARAHPYAVIGAGLGALDGLLHGAVSLAAHQMISTCLQPGRRVDQVISETLRTHGHLPGFGHVVYRHKDPRADFLLALMGEQSQFEPALTAARQIIDTVSSRTGLFANLDLALAVFALGTGMTPDAGEAIFAVARTAGWIAHAMEEYRQPPSRLRPVAHYTGPQPW